MSRNTLLETLVEMSWPEEYYADYYQTESNPAIRLGKKEDIFHISGIQNKMRDDAHSDDFGYLDFGELMKNAYVRHLELRLDLERGERTGPTRLQPFNWGYTQELHPGVFLGFDLDLDKNYLRITVLTDPNDLIREKVIAETHSFMEQAGMPQKEAPQRFGY